VPGLDPLWVLNHFHYLDNNKNGRRPMAFSRYAGLGSHRYPVGFSGDTTVSWDSLDFQPYFTATASNSGYGWWSHDIGGHMHGKRDDELAVRWVQFGVFSPINRLHSSCSPFNSKEPWRFLPWAESVMKKFLRLRHALVPYLYSMNLRASRDGMPLVQPMYYADPYNEKAYNVPNQYYFGTELVVCPITKPIDAEARAACFVAWIPNGVWIDFFNGRVYSGGRNLELWRDVEAPAVLAKAGGIVPMSADDTRNSVEAPENLDVFVFAGANGEFSLMEDTQEEAVGKNQTKQWAETKFCLDWSNGLFKIYAAKGNIDAVPKTRSWKIHFCGFEETTVKMEIHGKTAYCKKNKRLTVELPKMDSGTEICIRLGETVLAQNDVEQTAFDFLDNAWIAYDTKSRAFDAIKSGKATTAIIAELQAMDELPRPVFSGLCEILCAF
jgi:alpha-glucosidase (family GH31 glycosyl hydrolase)